MFTVMLVGNIINVYENRFCSSAAKHLINIAATGDDHQSIEMRHKNENIWRKQKNDGFTR